MEQRLKEMGAYLRSLKTYSVRADTTKDEVLDSGQKIQFGGSATFRVRNPAGLQADLVSDRKERRYYYDGKNVTQYAPRMKYYATAPVSAATNADLVQVLQQRYGIELPLSDLFLWGTDKANATAFASAIDVGPARIDGALCDHFAIRQNDVDWQVWIEQGARPLPRKLVITTTGEPSQPQYTTLLRWDPAAKVDAGTFVFKPPQGATKIELKPAATASAQ